MIIYCIALLLCSFVECMETHKRSAAVCLVKSSSQKDMNGSESINSSPLRRSSGSNPIAIDFSYLFDAVKKNDYQTIKNTKTSVLRSVRDAEGNNLMHVALCSYKNKPRIYMIELLTPHTNFFDKNNSGKTIIDCMDLDSTEYFECATFIAEYLEKKFLQNYIGSLTFKQIKILCARANPDDLTCLKTKYAFIKKYLFDNDKALCA